LTGPIGFGKLFGNFVSTFYLFLVRLCISHGLFQLLDPMPLVRRSSAAPVSVKSHSSKTGKTNKDAVR
jgi:hypothetical protein